MQMSPRQFEAFCFKQIEEFDRTFFGGVGCVIGVQLTRFRSDYNMMAEAQARRTFGTTFGMYDSATRCVYLNYHFRAMVNRGYFVKELRAVLYHELIHAVLIVAHQPLRLGMYCDDMNEGHGPEFQRLWKLNDEFCDVDLTKLAYAIFQRMESGL